MPDITTLGVFMLAALTLNITPGPDMLYVIARSVGQSRTAGIVSALGIAGGTVFHTLAVAFGLSALLISVPLAFEVVKYVGAAYLLYLGLRTILSKDESVGKREIVVEKLSRIFRQGVITNILNPKVALFFLAFLPQFVDTSRGSSFWQIILLGVLFNTSGTIVNCIVALLAASAGGVLRTKKSFMRVQRWFTGGVFMALGVRIALADRN